MGQPEVRDLRQDQPRAIPMVADAPDEGDFLVERGDHRVVPLGMCDSPGTMIVEWTKRSGNLRDAG